MVRDISYTEVAYDNYQEMADYAVGWSHLCNYQLTPTPISGQYKILELPSMQLAFSDNIGGIMYNFDAPKDTLCVSIMQEVEGKACLDNIKLQTGDIVFFSDEKRYNFMSSSRTKLLDISIKKSQNSLLYNKLSSSLHKCIRDTNDTMKELILGILDKYDSSTLDKEKAFELEQKIINTLLNSLESQEAKTKPLTQGEKVVALIRDRTFFHMDAKVNLEALAKKYNVSEKTLQSGFKSLFGFTPIHFLRLLKLNLVRNELIDGEPDTHKISRVALKWGFTHMGRFSHYYKELFLETPSETLKLISKSEGLSESCVMREEEID